MKKRIEKLIEEKMLSDDEKSQSDVAFLRSLSASYDKWGNLTDKQRCALERMEYLNSPSGLKEVEEWTEEYRSRCAHTARIVALYYLKNSYFFRDLCVRIVSDQNYVPTKRQFSALCGNKYAKKVIGELNRPPIFGKGDLVRLREGRGVPTNLSPHRGRPCVVIENRLDTINSHAQGSKEYRLLPFGSATTIVCQERHIKGMRKKAK